MCDLPKLELPPTTHLPGSGKSRTLSSCKAPTNETPSEIVAAVYGIHAAAAPVALAQSPQQAAAEYGRLLDQVLNGIQPSRQK